MNKQSLARIAYLSGALALGSLQGCTTTNSRISPQPKAYSPPLTTSYADQQKQRVEREKERTNGAAGDFLGRFVGEGLLRLLVP